MKKYRILYTFGQMNAFQNSVTVTAHTLDEAMIEAKQRVEDTYGKDMIKKFSFKPDALECGTVIR